MARTATSPLPSTLNATLRSPSALANRSRNQDSTLFRSRPIGHHLARRTWTTARAGDAVMLTHNGKKYQNDNAHELRKKGQTDFPIIGTPPINACGMLSAMLQGLERPDSGSIKQKVMGKKNEVELFMDRGIDARSNSGAVECRNSLGL